MAHPISKRLSSTHAKCGLVDIRIGDEECFRWCRLYHHSEKKKHSDRISVLKKISGKYNYEDMVFPADYNSIEAFEERNQVRVLIYEIDPETNDIRSD